MFDFVVLVVALLAFASGANGTYLRNFRDMEDKFGGFHHKVSDQYLMTDNVEELYYNNPRAVNVESCSRPIDFSYITFTLYTRMHPEEGEKLKYHHDDFGYSVRNSTYNPKLFTKFFVHARGQHVFSATELRKNWLLKYNVNVIVVNWEEYAFRCDYESMRDNVVPAVAEHFYHLMKALYSVDSTPKDHFHLVGVGEGCYIAAQAAKKFNVSSAVARLTGFNVDSEFYSGQEHYQLKHEDAVFVDVVYTALPLIKEDESMAHAFFYPNNGTHPQPGCPSGTVGYYCSYRSDMKYWVASFIKPYKTYKNGSPSNDYTYFGEFASFNARGKYFFEIEV